ncbi:phosphatase PAP2 family protein [Paenarthrobacter nitroguajacolicus]|uniref:phosphatase PAP2 family protein n=1 Tax=Paenarthrobacter nitroguajacolicus TaxID=211146 RepID=UPI002858910C|nr:phosphatase PAP2 family protein [Paenarthrobacter nitroguajacolicus]MDR6638616.1 undecaprenyl-diphosphatase [Paenarthrobacter nitroguajacolicus]
MIRVLHLRARPGWRTALAGVLLFTAFIIPGVMLLVGQGEPAFTRVDTWWQAFVFTLRSPFWDGLNAFLNSIGYVGMLVLHALLAAALLVWRRPVTATFALTSGVAALALTQLAKVVVGRQRPEGAKVLADTGSYPSGHVSATTAFLVVLLVLLGRWWVTVLAVLGVIAMMISRTYLSAHWLSDVFGGACLASGVVFLLWWRFRRSCIAEDARSDGKAIWSARALRRRPGAGRAE